MDSPRLCHSHLSLFAYLIADKRGEATLSSVLASHHAAAAAANPFNMGYPFVSPYPTYSNGDPISMPMVSDMGAGDGWWIPGGRTMKGGWKN